MAAKKKTNNKYVPTAEDIKRLRTQMSTRQPSATIGPKSATARLVNQSKLADPYKGAPRGQAVYNALNTAGKVAAEGAMIGLGGGAFVRGATKLAAKGAGKYVGNLSTQSAMVPNMKGLKGATGMGGKVSRTQTPMGPTLRSTEIGTAKQQAARIGNLESYAIKKSVYTGSLAGRKAMIDVFKVGAKVKQGGATLGGAAVTGRNRPISSAKNPKVDLKKATKKK
jgi:hypothetical protein